MSNIKHPGRQYLREYKLPHFFCAGCGCGQVLNYFTQAVSSLGIDISSMITIGGVGCTARMPVYLKTDTLHGVHGRTLAWATGINMMMPDNKIVIFAGDGDLASIGGNHFIHACRRNLDVTVILVNNLNFAMTGGQVAPTTPWETVTMTTPYGSHEPRFDICALAVTAGATYVARQITSKPTQCVASIKKALAHKGFSLVEIVSQCPTHFGRYALKTGDPQKLVDWINERAVDIKDQDNVPEERRDDVFVCGEFINVQRPLFRGTTVC